MNNMKIYVERLFSEQKPKESGYYFTRYQTGKLWSDEGFEDLQNDIDMIPR